MSRRKWKKKFRDLSHKKKRKQDGKKMENGKIFKKQKMKTKTKQEKTKQWNKFNWTEKGKPVRQTEKNKSSKIHLLSTVVW